MADISDSRPAHDGATGDSDWAFLALTPILIAAVMLAAAAAFADVKTETPVAAVEAPLQVEAASEAATLPN